MTKSMQRHVSHISYLLFNNYLFSVNELVLYDLFIPGDYDFILSSEFSTRVWQIFNESFYLVKCISK